MITLTLLLILIIAGAFVFGTVGAGIIVVFGDFIVAGLVIYFIYKLVTGKGSKKN